MSDTDRDALFERAAEILRANDRGTYTVPTAGLYPFQWNWDSCLVALGQRHLDEARAWTEIDTLFAHQWEDGMVPHIVFHEPDEGYFPGPGVWGTGRPVPTSGITQPPVAGFAAAAAVRPRARCRTGARPGTRTARGDRRVARVVPPLPGPRRYRARRADPPLGVGARQLDRLGCRVRARAERRRRAVRATRHDARRPGHRPTKAQYDRYVWLLERFRGLDWDNARLHDALPVPRGRPGVQRHPDPEL